MPRHYRIWSFITHISFIKMGAGCVFYPNGFIRILSHWQFYYLGCLLYVLFNFTFTSKIRNHLIKYILPLLGELLSATNYLKMRAANWLLSKLFFSVVVFFNHPLEKKNLLPYISISDNSLLFRWCSFNFFFSFSKTMFKTKKKKSNNGRLHLHF